MSESLPEGPNNHENDSENNSRRQKIVRKKRRRPLSTFSSSNSSSSNSDETRKRKRYKKKHRKKRLKRRSWSSSVESQPKRSDMSTERIRVVDEEEQFKWELDILELAKYANDHFNVFIPEKNLKDNILIETLVPSNMQDIKKLDKFILQLVKEKRQKALLAQDMLYEKIQKKNVDVMGPLRKLLQFLEQAKREGENSTVVLENLLRFSQKVCSLLARLTQPFHVTED